MSFGAFDRQRAQPMMSDINVTPMVDVMLVLLVIFILAAPVFTHHLALELPRAGSGGPAKEVRAIVVSMDGAGSVYIGADRLTPAQLDARLAAGARQLPQPELQLQADRNTRYEAVAQVMAAAQARGLAKIVFVTEPGKENQDGKR